MAVSHMAIVGLLLRKHGVPPDFVFFNLEFLFAPCFEACELATDVPCAPKKHSHLVAKVERKLCPQEPTDAIGWHKSFHA